MENINIWETIPLTSSLDISFSNNDFQNVNKTPTLSLFRKWGNIKTFQSSKAECLFFHGTLNPAPERNTVI